MRLAHAPSQLHARTMVARARAAAVNGTNAARSLAFRRETGTPPGVYRRRVQRELCHAADE
jgi:hypothetical protein